MKKNPALSLKECFAILGIPEGSGLDDIKRAYRKRAFELHPDLNPSDGASRQFQQLNEAYVILIRLADNSTASSSAAANARPEAGPSAARAGHSTYRDQAQKEQKEQRQKEQREKEQREKERKARQEEERRAREAEARRIKEDQLLQEKKRREEERRERLRQEIERQESDRLARQERVRQEKERKEKERLEKERQEEARRMAEQAEAAERAAAARREAESQARAQQEAPQAAQHAPTASSGPSGHAPYGSAYSVTDAGEDSGTIGRENLLNDLLSDPFARRVYEDIYREVQQRKESAPPPETGVSGLLAGEKSPAEMAKNLGKAVKGWLREQIDEEQELYFPAAKLFPGARIRLQIRRGLANELKTVEITLPPDFKVGKPVRLRGMGKKIGKWQGDLYLIFQQKEQNG